MKLNKLHKSTGTDLLRSYIKGLRGLLESKKHKIFSEAKITIVIDDDETKKSPGISIESRDSFIEKAKAIGNFDDQVWVNSLIKSMEQAGVQGFNKLCEDEKPITNKQVQQLIGSLVDLVSGK
jgi:hypothetical protein